ncbi:MAG: DUF302 domain-containing protein [Bacteroidota bacterium]
MNYYYSTKISGGFDSAIEKVTAELKKEGFGVLTEIDVADTLKKKLDVDFRPYRILGACNPPFAYQALQNEDKIGVLLPCNFIVQQVSEDEIEVAAVNPLVSMQNVQNDNLNSVASQIAGKIERIINRL